MIVHFSTHISKWELVCKFGMIFHIIIISCLCSRFHVRNQWFLLCNNLFIYQVLCPLIYRRRSLYSFLWKYHTEMLSNKISKYCGVLSRLKNYLPLFIFRTVYFSMVHSHLNYGLFARGFDSNRMIKLQKRCVRIKRSRYNAHTQPLMKQLNIRSVPDMLLLNSMKLYYKYKRNEVPHYFTSFNLHKAQLTTTTTARETTSGQIECASISLKNVFEIICRKR